MTQLTRFQKRIPKGSILFAPMEGITDESYRLTIEQAFPEWDYYFCDFLRIPKESYYSKEKIVQHFGSKILERPELLKKTGFQILTPINATTIEHLKRIEDLGVPHIDLNLGCPSRKVNSHKGGSYLLKDLSSLAKLLREIRANFKGIFTTKIRIGYDDDTQFENIIKLIESEGVEAITIHARTKKQKYEGRADWKYIERAVKLSNIPIIGNGDIWTIQDIKEIFEQTNCHAIMAARGALKTPWLASIYKEYESNVYSVNDEFLLYERKKYIDSYFDQLKINYQNKFRDESGLLRRYKAFSRYLFDDFQNAEIIKSNLLRSMTLKEFQTHLEML